MIEARGIRDPFPNSLPRFVFITRKFEPRGIQGDTQGEAELASAVADEKTKKKKKEKSEGRRKREFQRRFGDVIKNTGRFVVARIPTKLD